MGPRTGTKRKADHPDKSSSKRTKRSNGNSSVLNAVDSHSAKATTPAQTREYLKQLEDSDEGTSSSDERHDFEDVPGIAKGASHDVDHGDKGHESGQEDDMDWEDAGGSDMQESNRNDVPTDTLDIADVTVTLNDNIKHGTATDRAASSLKKGPSKRERQVRNGSHCIHVQALMWHNAIRNSWLNDQQVHRILLSGLPEGVRMEIDKWRANMGMPKLNDKSDTASKRMAKLRAGDAKKKKGKRGGRDWDRDAERQEKGAINMSHGDPTLRLLKVLTAYWRKRFTVAAPGLRKIGYMPLKRLTQEINSWKKDKSGVTHGERIENLEAFRALARKCEGSRDVGSQLFTALMRALGLDVRMVANLQPAGIGWGKIEEAKPARDVEPDRGRESSNIASDDSVTEVKTNTNEAKAVRKTSKGNSTEKSTRQSSRAANSKTIALDTDSDSALSSPPSDLEDDDSVVDVTASFAPKRPSKKYDRDMHYPLYWSEVLLPVNNTFVPVDPIVLSTVATNGELISSFEPRGKRADQAKQSICYTVAHSSDGTAKDVTVRYLKKHQLPGRTKGYRIPIEKIKVYDRKGKVKKYEEYDWFKTVMSVFERSSHLRTAADDLEEATDLKPAEPDMEKPKAETESLQWYKQSADFVLERHLRREEALPPTAEPVKIFNAGKGEKAVSEPVYRRKDILTCKTAESWHKEGREIKMGEQPMKLVPMRAVTTMRKREMEDIERETGEKAKQGLFARDQTDWIIPPPIGEDRVIPRNAFGNIDVYVPSMVPKGAVHIPYKGTARVCRDLEISHAEAVTGFEFGKRMAIPVVTGVVVAEENKEKVIELWKEREKVKKEKEDAKKSQVCLALWRKFFSGLRIMERMKREYEGTEREEDINPFVRKKVQDMKIDMANGDGGEGGFVRETDAEIDRGDNAPEEEDDGIQDMEIEIDGTGFFADKVEEKDISLPDTSVRPMSLKASKAQANDVKQEAPLNDTSDGTDEDDIKATPISSRGQRKGRTIGEAHGNTPKGSKGPAARSNGTKSSTRKVSPTKSQYFGNSDSTKANGRSKKTKQQMKQEAEEGHGAGAASDRDSDRVGTERDEESSEDLSSEEEVIKPRMTTARTRIRSNRG